MNDQPQAALARYIAAHPDTTRWCIAYSGGMDSHVLLHLAVELLGTDDTMRLRAVHVDHALHPDSGGWALHARTVAESLGVSLRVHEVSVRDGGDGPEAAARDARYAAFADGLDAGEHLLLAQHADDQAETFLLQALRGSGPDGLAAIPYKRTFASGVLARPLLGCTRQRLREIAESVPLSWIEDPSNADTAFDRNYLRHEIMPRLAKRWPAANRTLGRAALRSAAASQTLLGIAGEDLALVRVRGADELSISELRALPRERIHNALRLWIRRAGFRMPRLVDLEQVLTTLIQARDDSGGIVDVREYEFRRFRDRLYLLEREDEPEAFEHVWPAPFDDLDIPETGFVLTRGDLERQGIALPLAGVVSVRSRVGGEEIKLGEPAFHKAVRKLLQEAGVPPWQRAAVPLIWHDERLVAVWNLAVAVDYRTRRATGA